MTVNETVRKVFDRFDTDDVFVSVSPLGNGNINDTYLIGGQKKKYTLQRINTDVFKNAEAVMRNISLVTEHVASKGCRTLRVVMANGKPYTEEGGVYRMFEYVEGESLHIATPELFGRAAHGFGQFASALDDFDASVLTETIPNFHNTPSRFRNFCDAVESDPFDRRKNAEKEIEYYLSQSGIYGMITDAIASGDIPLRVTHNDTKLDNVVFCPDGGMCVIDLDTVMPGSALYDFGDAIRSGTNSCAEDEPDASKVECRRDLYDAFTEGYLYELGGNMTKCERELLPLSARIMTLECGMRFLTDYLQGDTYFKVSRPEHNLDRTRTQIALDKCLPR